MPSFTKEVLFFGAAVIQIMVGVALAQRLKIDVNWWLAIAVIGAMALSMGMRRSRRDLPVVTRKVALALLVAAAFLAVVTALHGEERQGATRWLVIHDGIGVRAGLWAIVLFSAGYSILMASGAPGAAAGRRFTAAAAITATAIMTSFAVMPDMYSAMMFAGVLLACVLTSSGHRFGALLSIGALPLAVLATWIIAVDYRPLRALGLMGGRGLIATDTSAGGWAAHNSRLALEKAAWLGVETGSPPLALPPRIDWYGLSHVGYQFGLFALALVMVCLAVTVICAIRAITANEGSGKPFWVAVPGVFVVNAIVAVGPAFGLLPYVGHYGIPFLSMGDTAFLGAMLVAGMASSRGSPITVG